MIKKILLLSIISLSLAHNSEASQLTMPSLPFSKTKAALGLSAFAATCIAGNLGYRWWYDKTFTNPLLQNDLEWLQRHECVVSVHEAINLSRQLLEMTCTTMPQKIDYIFSKNLHGTIEGKLKEIKNKLEEQQSECKDSLEKIQHYIDIYKNKVTGVMFGTIDYQSSLEAFQKLQPEAKELLKTLEKQHAAGVSNNTALMKKGLKIQQDCRIHDEKIATIKKESRYWIPRIALSAVALYGATRLFSWYRNK